VSTSEDRKTLGSSREARDQIIGHLASALEPMSTVVALWLEGADGRGTVDEHSDIDLVIAVEDGAEDAVFAAVKSALTDLADIDHAYEEPAGAPGLQHRVYHLARTDPSLLIDVVIQPASREFVFDPNHPDEVPRVLFDKANVVRFEAPDRGSFARFRAQSWHHAQRRFLPEARVARYVQRGEYLEGVAAYQKYVVGPLVELLRLKHAPRTSGYGLVHISTHLPPDVVHRLEGLYRVGSAEELGRKLTDARIWFDEIVQEGAPK